MAEERGRGRRPLAVAVATVAVTLVATPFAHVGLGAAPSFMPAVLATVALCDVLSVVLLAGQYLDNGDLRFLATSWAYVWSLVLMGGYALAFPGVTIHPPLASTNSVAPWCYVGWHAGFPLLLGVAWAPWPVRLRHSTPRRDRRRVMWSASAAMAAMSMALVAGVVAGARHLPVLIHGLDTTRMTVLTAPAAVPLVAAAVVATWKGTRRRRGPETWIPVTALVCLCDLCLTYTAHLRFSLGWYAGRSLTVLAAALVLMAMLGEFRRLKSAAELGATTDGLTGLANRRLLEAVLAVELSRAGRTGGSTAVLVLDLDGFKVVNDIQGHEAGDDLLREASGAWSLQLRDYDLLARTGGDEFAVVLADTTRFVAEQVAVRLAGVTPPEVGVSVGVAVSEGDHDVASLLRAADADMYRVKGSRHGGRDTRRDGLAAPAQP